MIFLYGTLAEKYGRKHTFPAPTIKHALHYLSNKYKGFRQDFARGQYVVKINDYLIPDVGAVDLQANKIEFLPVIAGSGSGVGTALLGGALIASAFMTGGATFAGGTLAFSGAGSFLFGTGLSLAIGGITQLASGVLAPDVDDNEAALNQNYIFGSGVNTAKAGVPVPLVFGKEVRCGSVVIAADITNI